MDSKEVLNTPGTYYLSPERSTDEEIQKSSGLLAECELAMAVLETVTGGGLVIDGNRQIVAINQTLCSALGLTGPESALGQRPGELFGCRVPEGAPGSCGTGEECRHCGLVNTIVEAIQTNGTAYGECRIALKSGDGMELDVAATPRKVDSKEFVFVGVHDISGEKRREVLERMFFHDILNTAGGVVGALRFLEDQLADNEEHKLVTASYVLAQNMTEEIRAQRQLMAAERGELVMERMPISTSEMLKSVVELFRNHEVAYGKTLKLLAECSINVHTDPALLRRITTNMVKNALEATSSGGVVTVESIVSDEAVVFRVTNPGVIPQEVKLQIFQRSFSTKGEGRGIGTYSMKLLGERYLGGRVEFRSNATVQTQFEFRLSRDSEAQAKVSKQSDAEFDLTLPSQVKTLIADDNPINQLVARRLVEQTGWSADVASDGAEALQMVERNDYDLVLMDMHMPKMDGLEATRAIRRLTSQKAKVLIVALTANNGKAELQKCIDAGMDAMLEKPFSLELLKTKIGRELLVRLAAQ